MAGGVIRVEPTGQPERYGLGDVPSRWPDLRVFNDGPKVTLEADHSFAIVPFKIPWNRHQRLCAELLGNAYTDIISFPGYKRNLPEAYRNWNWSLESFDGLPIGGPVPVMHCTRIMGLEGVGDGSQETGIIENDYYPSPGYAWARVTAFFETLAFDVRLWSSILETPGNPKELQRYVIRTEDDGGKFLTFNWGQWILKSGSNVTQPIARQVSFFEPYKTVRWEWLDVLEGMCNHTWNQTVKGRTNKFAFDGGRYAAGTLLLQKAERAPKMDPFGTRIYRHTFEATYFPSGVNRALPPTAQQMYANGTNSDGTPVQPYWDIVDVADQTTKPYIAMDYDRLFKP